MSWFYGPILQGTALLGVTNNPPTVSLNSPSDGSSTSDTTPTFDFTGTDTESDDIRYQIQVDTVNTFDSGLTPTLIASTKKSGASNVTSDAIDTTGADFLILAIVCDDAYNTTPTDSKGNTWTQATSYTQTNVRVRLWYSIPTSVGSGHTFSASGGILGTIFPHAFSGVLQTSPADQQSGSNSFGSSLQPGSITPSEDGELLFSVYGINSAGVPISINSSFTETQEEEFSAGVNYGGATAYLVQSTAAAINPTWTRTNSNGQAVTLISFKRNVSPLLSKVSGTDAGFVNPDVGGDTDPFTSGDNIQYTVQAGDELTDDTYYWRVRGIDPLGTNSYGAWSSTRSFTVSTGTGSNNQRLTLLGVS